MHAMSESTTYVPTEATAAAVRNLIDYLIEREHGQDVEAEINGVRAVARAGIQFDLRNEYPARRPASTAALEALVDTELRMLVRDGLAARRCQCAQMHAAGLRRVTGDVEHGHNGACEGHTEADVPEVDGYLLCGGCHGAEWRARQ
jgi:hypothetical protein